MDHDNLTSKNSRAKFLIKYRNSGKEPNQYPEQFFRERL